LWFRIRMASKKIITKMIIIKRLGKPANYSGAHISWHELVLAGNQSNHQNLVPSILIYKF
jgi:hypothetical protein